MAKITLSFELPENWEPVHLEAMGHAVAVRLFEDFGVQTDEVILEMGTGVVIPPPASLTTNEGEDHGSIEGS